MNNDKQYFYVKVAQKSLFEWGLLCSGVMCHG